MATARWATMTMMIATGKDNGSNDGNGATGNEVDNDGDSATHDGAMGYDDDDDDNNSDNDGDGATGNKVGRDRC